MEDVVYWGCVLKEISGFLEPSSPFASWSPWGEQLCSTMVFCLSIVQKQWRQIAMDQNHNPRPHFPSFKFISGFIWPQSQNSGTTGSFGTLSYCFCFKYFCGTGSGHTGISGPTSSLSKTEHLSSDPHLLGSVPGGIHFSPEWQLRGLGESEMGNPSIKFLSLREKSAK